MSSTSSPRARDLFAAARKDGPDADEQDALFRKIAVATGVAATAAALSVAPPVGTGATAAAGAQAAAAAVATHASSATVVGGAVGVKLLSVGVVLGAVCTAFGVVLTLALVTGSSGARASGRVAVTVAPATTAPGAKLAQPATRRRDPDDADGKAIAKAKAKATASAEASNASAGVTSDLAEEARIVTSARQALMAGDPAQALSLVQATRKLGARSLEPEELGLEARALRALGRADDAAATELVLRRRYPDHALSR